MRALALLPVFALALGCVTYDRGVLAAASTRALAPSMTVAVRNAEGRACGAFSEARYARAVEDALVRSGGNALVNATYTSEELCIVVRGTAVRLRSEP